MVLVCPQEVKGSGLDELQSVPLNLLVLPSWGLQTVKPNLPLLFIYLCVCAQLFYTVSHPLVKLFYLLTWGGGDYLFICTVNC